MAQLLDIRRFDIPAELLRDHPEAFADPALGSAYRNPWAHPPLPSLRSVLRWKTARSDARPEGYRPTGFVLPRDPLEGLHGPAHETTRLFFLGHASFLFDLEGFRLLVDPLFGRAGGVVPRHTPAAASADALGPVDAVLVTHGHHDHLDPASLAAVARRSQGKTVFVVPRGLARVLPHACRRVVEVGWWDVAPLEGARVVFVPSQHWHRRGLFDTNRGLWGGYVVEGHHRLYHSGDTGYFGGFRAIGRAFGGVDAACLPLGAYAPTWFMATQHMDPDGSLAAFEDLGATHFVGMHFGTFDLSDEPLDAGPRYVDGLVRAGRLPCDRVHLARPGGTVSLTGPSGATRAAVRHRFDPEDRR